MAGQLRARRPTGKAGGDHDDVGVLEGSLEAVVGGEVAGGDGGGGDVGEILSNTGGVDDIVQGELVDEGARLEEQRQGLADSAGGTENNWAM